MADDTKKTLQTQLWNIANTLRGKMGADEFRDYILGFIFYKYLSERMRLFADEILVNDGLKFDAIDESTKDGQAMLETIKEEAVERLGYFLKPSELFHKVAEKGAQKTDNFILEDLSAILKHIESSTMGHASEDDFEGLFEDLDLGSSKLGKTESQKNELIAKVLAHLDKIDFRLADTEADVLGDAYEYLIGQFASGAGKKAGEFYTPQEVSTILAKIVTTGKTKLKSVYDPTCGSGSLLLRVAKEVEDVGSFYGQEMNPTTYNLARMNMILHGVHYQRFDLKNEDTLEHPAPEHADLRFEAIVANPPFSANWSASEVLKGDDRFSAYGKLAPSSKADFAFVQHMVHHLDHGATMACVLPHGVLFRGGAEEHIRRYLIDTCNYLDAVIGLPANIFYGTGIPTCILVLKKGREHPDDILFIDASQGFEKVGNQNYLRPEHIERIVTTYRKREGIDKFSQVADLSQVQENEFNLSIPRYVDTSEEEEQIDLNAVVAKLSTLAQSETEADGIIAFGCDKLGLPFPSGHNVCLLDVYKKSVMHRLFTRALRFRDDYGNAFPDWEQKTLGAVITSLDAGVSVNSEDVPAGEGEFGVLKTSCVTQGSFNPNENKRVSDEGERSRLKEPVTANTIIISRMNTPALVGMSGFVRESHANLFLPDRLWAAKVSSDHSAEWTAYLFSSPMMRTIISSKATGTSGSMKNITKDDVLSIPILLPSPEEQIKIANFLSALDRKIAAVAGQVTV
jgi:type I restriction enzyme M protein